MLLLALCELVLMAYQDSCPVTSLLRKDCPGELLEVNGVVSGRVGAATLQSKGP
jgi:hypothetical protein